MTEEQAAVQDTNAVVRPGGWWSATRTFGADLGQLGEARGWARGLFGPCLAADDCVLVVSELLANCAVHGGGGEATVSLTHGVGGVIGELIHHRPPVGVIGPKTAALNEVEFLRSDRWEPEGTDAVIASLGESGRGLLGVLALCGGSLRVTQDETCSVVRWLLETCACEVRGGGGSYE